MRVQVFVKTKNVEKAVKEIVPMITDHLNLGHILEKIRKKYEICFHDREFRIDEVKEPTKEIVINEYGEKFPIKEIEGEEIIREIDKAAAYYIEKFLENRDFKELIDSDYIMIIDFDEWTSFIWHIIDTPILPFTEKNKKYFKLLDIVSED